MPPTSRIAPFVLAALAALGAAGAAQAQARLQCESRDYGYQFCPIGGGVDDAVLVEQRSRSACVQGVSWGWDRRGVWVDRGCEGVFDVRIGPPVAAVLPNRGGAIVTCESRDYRQQLCPLPVAVTRVQLVAQRSQAPCIEGRTWGWRPDGIWVTGGCEADFQVHAAQAPVIVAPQPARPPIVVAPPAQQWRSACRRFASAVSKAQSCPRCAAAKGIRISDFGFPSAFGFRVSDLRTASGSSSTFA